MAELSRTVLVIDGSPENCDLYRSHLIQDQDFSYQVLIEPLRARALQLCQGQSFDGILLGFHDFPNQAATEALGMIEQLTLSLGEQCPPIVVVGCQRVQVAVQALKQGAADYLVRDQLTSEDLRYTLRSAIDNARLKRQLKSRQERFHTSVENLMDCFGIFTAMRDDDGTIVDFRIDYLNQAACKNNQVTFEQQVGRGLCEVLPGHMDSGLFEAYCQLVATGKPLVKDSVIYEDSYGKGQQLIRAFDIRATKLDDGFVASWRDITERKRLELELNFTVTSLQQEQHRLKQLINQAPVGIGIGSAGGEVQVINDTMLHLYGLDRPTFEQQGMNWQDSIPPEQSAQVSNALEQLSQKGTFPPQEWKILRPDGRRVTVWMSASQLTDGTHNHVAFAIDLTPLKQAEAHLQEERQLRRALDSLFSFVGLLTPDGILLDANRTALEAANLMLADVVNRPFETAYWWTESAPVQAQLRQAIDRAAQGETVRYDVDVRLADDQYITIDFALVPLVDGQGQVEYLVPSGIDVTQRKQVEASLKASQNQLEQQLTELETIYQSAPIGLNVLDRDLRFVRINQRLADINGLSVEAHLGRTVGELLPNLADAAEQMLRPIFETGEPLLNVEIEGETPAQPGVKRTWVEHFLPLKRDDEVIGINTVCQEITEAKRQEAALRASETRFRLLTETIQDVFWITDFQIPQVLYVSPAYEKIWGRSVEAVYGDHGVWLETIHPADRDRFQTAFEHIHHQDGIELEYRIVRPDGEIRWIRDRGFNLRDPSGKIQQTVGIAHDVTRQKQTELALQTSEQRLRLGMQVAGFALARFDYATDTVELTPEAAILYGLPTDQLIVSRQQLYANFHPDDRDKLSLLMQQVCDPTGPGWFICDHRIVLPSGEERWLSVRKQVFFEASGPSPKASHAILAAIDITRRKQVEESLRSSEERYRTLFETMEDGFCVIEMLFDAANHPVDYYFVELNPAFERHTGLYQAEGKSARQMLPDLENHWFEIYGRVALTGEPMRFENGSDAMNRWFEVYAFRLGGADSRKVALLFKDISDRKTIEIERERLLQQEHEAREAAERANRIKDEFLAILSHELRTPLNPILGWSKLLQTRQMDQAKTRKALSTIERNAKLQTQLIDDLLDVARILRGKLKLDTQPVALRDVIEAALETVRSSASAKSIHLAFASAPSLQVSGDPARLQQIVWNLLSNAIKFTPSQGQVTIDLVQVGDQAQISVTDTGQGINTSFLPHIFESFRQEDVSITRQHGGLGLGLSIVRYLVEAHGGTIRANSEGEGQGSSFTVHLPLLQKSSPLDANSVNLAKSLNLSGLRVLAVDDEADARNILEAILTFHQAEVRIVGTATALLQQLADFQPHVLICDLGMPGIDGYHLIHQVRRLPGDQGGQTPAIALTAYAREEDKQRTLDSGFQHHMAKPFELEDLVQAVANLARQHHSL